MRYDFLTLILMVSIILMANTEPVLARNTQYHHKQQRSGLDPSKSRSFCRIDLKSTKVASKAADVAKAANDAQPCASEEAGQRAMQQMADKAEIAARAAGAALNGKSLLLEHLENTQNETVDDIQEMQIALKASRCSIETIARVDAQMKEAVEQMQILHDEIEANLVEIREAADDIKKFMIKNQAELLKMEQQSCNLKKCFMTAKEDLERTERLAEQSEDAARQATERINAVQDALKKIKRLRRKDDKSLRQIVLRLIKK